MDVVRSHICSDMCLQEFLTAEAGDVSAVERNLGNHGL